MSICSTVIELHFFKKEIEHGQKAKNSFGSNLDIKWSYHEIVGAQFIFHMLCSIVSLEVVSI